AGIEAAVDKATGTKAIPGNSVALLIEGQYFESLWPTLRQAKDSILISSLKIDDGPYGKQTADILAEKAKAGVQVRVLLDTFNSRGDVGKDSIAKMRQAGVHVYLLDKPVGRTVMEIQHRKLTIVDGDTAYVGGQNLDWAGHNAHDATMKVRGPVVANLHQLSVDLWRQAGAPELPDPPMPRPQSVGKVVLRPLVTDPCDRSFKEAVLAAIDAAKDHIYLDQVFFSDTEVIERLGHAAKRGVKVELVIPQKSYSKEINAVNRLDLPKLINMGIHVRLNPHETHMKAMTIDGSWGVLGSTNLDGRALNDNYELSLAISNPETVQDLDRRILLPAILSSPRATPTSLAVPNQGYAAVIKDRVLSWGRRLF
ncbi:MAG: phosphatidylserine/phosphatidylglycerophosphate/cardiolipin synthase family protein, partial [Candidatus Sericytochromatia bacterium]|nr:phosphatidylserine/phosphatidylglycerophosphate/cardiolipin synthase family protein [Candidatus Sericytochromatia bacterium]